MPCTDIRENLDIELNSENAIFSYEISKKTCGAEVGKRALLLEWAKNYSAEEIISMHMDEFLEKYSGFIKDGIDDSQKFIVLKHFEILKKALQVIIGNESGQVRDDVIIDFLEYNNKSHTKARLLFEVGGVDAKENPGCGTGCSKGGCG